MSKTFISFALLICAGFSRGQIPVVVHETFDVNRYGWRESQTAKHKVMFKDGKYLIESSESGWMTDVAPYIEVEKDYSFEATFTQVSGKDDNGFGFVWGYNGKDQTNSFVITANGFYRISCSDPSVNFPNEWRETTLVKPMGKENKLKVEYHNAKLNFYVNGKIVASSKNFPWKGKYVGFVTYTQMHVLVDDFILSNDIQINLLSKSDGLGEKENLGASVNSKYDEVSPKISADGKTLYFGRKLSPENVGGVKDKEDIWETKSDDGRVWSKSFNLGIPVNSSITNNLIGFSTDNNTFLFHVNDGFAFMHRTSTGWSSMEDLGIHFNNESKYLEGCLSPDGKAIIFVACLKSNAYYRAQNHERDIYVCLKQPNGSWSAPIHTGKVLNSGGDEYAPFLSADGKTLYFGSNGFPGYGEVDIFMSKRLSDDWKKWSPPVNLGLGINTVGFDAYYTLPASGEFGYMVSNINTLGLTDIIRFKQPNNLKPEPVVLVSGKVLNAKTQKPLAALIRFDDLATNEEVGEARVNPKTGEYRIALPAGKHYGYHAAAPGFLSVNENLELIDVKEYGEVRKDLLLVPIAIGESIKLKNVFFVQSKSQLMPESYPELNRLVKIMKDNPTIEIELSGHTDSQGNPSSNLDLSESRVVEVKNYLVSKGVVARRITGKGYGGSKPIAPSDNEENRQLNRRVEFKIVKK